MLHQHAGVATGDQDVFVNAVGGVRISEPAADLAVLLSIHSSLRGKPLPRGFIAFGEVGLAGEVRPAHATDPGGDPRKPAGRPAESVQEDVGEQLGIGRARHSRVAREVGDPGIPHPAGNMRRPRLAG